MQKLFAKSASMLAVSMLLLMAFMPNVYSRDQHKPTTQLILLPCSAAVNFGETLQCSFAAPNEVDTFIFTANLSDKIIIRPTRVTGTIVPEFRLTPQGSATVICHGISGAICSIPSSGEYVIAVNERNNTNTGSYNLYIQRLNNPGNADPIMFGLTYPYELGVDSQINTSTFGANANDVVIIRMVRTTGEILASVELFAPNGSSVCEGLGNPIAVVTCKIPITGRYTLLTQDKNGQPSRGYNLYTQRVTGPLNAFGLGYNQVLNGSIAYEYQVESFVFFAKANSSVLIRMQRTSGDILSSFNVYDPMGNRFCGSVGGSSAQATCEMPHDGIYTIITEDQGDDGLGTYSLSLQCQAGICVGDQSVYLPLIVR